MNHPSPHCLKLREKWEKNLALLAEREEEGGIIAAILKDKNGLYFCHRYICVGPPDYWDISVDGRGVDSDTAICWFAQPKALSKTSQTV